MKTLLCKNCKNLTTLTNNLSCKAYPNGIPEEILTGNVDHTKKYKGDNNIQFEEL
mgnify:CR=1 FL=1|jgi:hypothetical protein